MLAESGGVCHKIGSACCTHVPAHTQSDGAFTKVMEKLGKLSKEMKENAGKGGGLPVDWFEQILGKWGAVWAKAAIGAAIVLILIFLLACCIVPILRRRCQKMVEDRADRVMGLQGAQLVNILADGHLNHMHTVLQGVIANPALRPTPEEPRYVYVQMDLRIETERAEL